MNNNEICIPKTKYNLLFGCDPAHMEKKKLHIQYLNINDKIEDIFFDENSEIKIKNIKKIIFAKYGVDDKEIDVTQRLLSNIYIPCIPKTGGGFFSCCSVRLTSIINYFNKHKIYPSIVISKKLFRKYLRKNIDSDGDSIVSHMFSNYMNNDIDINYIKKINYHWTYQYNIYKTLDFNSLNPFIKKYFSPSKSTQDIINTIEKKYNIDYGNTCVIFYRGGDKWKETKLAPYSDFFNQADKIKKDNPNIHFLIQSDETNFINECLEKYSNSFYFKDEIRHINNRKTVVDNVNFKNGDKFSFVQKYLAITIIMSRCKYIICPSGNCSIWIIFYRGNAENVIQYKDDKWYN